MARIIVDPPPTGHNLLANDFLKALTVLHDGGFELRSGTKLTSRYAVLVVEDSAADPAIAKLASANLKVARDAR
ncbi:hypothetical protein [Candidatus Binatus sp.]|uniref:hypothetical protein n=1 Tax=Candidatus Binatus sp. TaxID=2811406 RepID=UPI003CC695D5